MAIHPARSHWPAVVTLSLVVALIGPATAFAAPTVPAAPQPQSVAGVQRQLGMLSIQNSQLVEQYDQAQVAMDRARAAADHAQRVATAAEAAYAQARDVLAAAATAQYEAGGFAVTGALLSSNNQTNYLDQLNTMNAVSAHTAVMVSDAVGAAHTATVERQRATALLADTTAKRNALAARRDVVQRQVTKYTDLLATLTAAQRKAFVNAVSPSVPKASVPPVPPVPSVSGPASARALQAVRFALAQVGKPYVWGAAGPGSYDCSGLTMASWASAGVSLPHSAADQYNYGTHVSLNALEPGDLIFMYQPIGHVTIYIGNGLMVSAPTEGENVSVVPLSSFMGETVGATRIA